MLDLWKCISVEIDASTFYAMLHISKYFSCLPGGKTISLVDFLANRYSEMNGGGEKREGRQREGS